MNAKPVSGISRAISFAMRDSPITISVRPVISPAQIWLATSSADSFAPRWWRAMAVSTAGGITSTTRTFVLRSWKRSAYVIACMPALLAL